MNFSTAVKVGALFKCVVHKGDGVPTKETGWFHNLVLDSGLDQMSKGTWIDRVCVGSGNSKPTVDQVRLDNFVASTTNVLAYGNTSSNVEPYFYGNKRTYRYGEGAAKGNLTEIGLGWADDKMWNRTLIKDINGDPTTLTILEDEYLDVLIEVRVYLKSSGSGAFRLLDKVGGVISEHTYKMQPDMVNSSQNKFNRVSMGTDNNGNFIWISGKGFGTPTNPVREDSLGAYARGITYPNTRTVVGTWDAALTANNFAHKSFSIGIDGLCDSGYYNGYSVEIDPPITKKNTQVMRYSFSLSWERHEEDTD